MATAKEVLTRLAAPEIEPHIVIDADRYVTVPNELRDIAVQFDHNIETVVFDCPRYWDGHDLSTMRIFVNYIRPGGKIGQFPCTDVTVDSTDSNIMHFSWTISGHVTEVDGTISFLVCAKVTEGDGNLKNRWSSRLNQELIVSKGLDASDEISSFHPDVLTYMLERLEVLENSEAMSDKTAITSRLNTIENDIGLGLNKLEDMIKRIGTLEEGVDWEQNDSTSSSYISNRPMRLEERFATYNGVDEAQYMSADHPSVESLVGGTLAFMSKGVRYEYPIIASCSTQLELDTLKASQSTTAYAYITVGELLRSNIVGQMPGVEYMIWIPAWDRAGLIYYYSKTDDAIEPGLHCSKIEENNDDGSITYMYPTKLTWHVPVVDPKYKSLFNGNVQVINANSNDLSSIDFSSYSPGDIVLVVTS